MTDHRTSAGRWVRVVVTLSMIAAVISAAQLVRTAGPAAAAGPGSLTLDVASARSVNSEPGFVHENDPIPKYKWLINVDDTGNPGTSSNQLLDQCLPTTTAGGASNPDYADTCPWPSTRKTSGFAPIVAQGNETDLNDSAALGNLPPGKYLISVTADGFKIDGQHFTITSGATTHTAVRMNPTPLPLTTLRIQVFNDSVPVDGTYEVDAEKGLAGFTAALSDVMGRVSTDYYGNPLCTAYQHQAADGTGPMLFDANNKPIVDTAKSTGTCTSDTDGLIKIPNMGPNRYAATVTPPAPVPGQGYQWVQTTTLEGGHDHDIWSQENATGNDTEQVRGAEPVPSTQFGFVATKTLPVPAAGAPTGEIKGVVIAGLPYVGGQNGQVVPETGFAGAKSDGPIKNPWVALSDLGAGDAAVYVGRGAADGSFDIVDVPDGTYQLTLWDDDQDYILWSFNVEVHNGDVINVGNKMLVGWFTRISGTVFVDSNANGKRDTGERAVPSFTLTTRERDNSLMDQATNTAITDVNGNYDIKETYPLGKWLVLEGFNTRYKTTGITYKGANETKATTQLGSLVDINFLPIIGLRGQIDWGVQPYNPGTNGGIVGTVTYDTTRNELDPAKAATEPYQPGIPGVPVRLYVPLACTVTTPVDLCRQGYQTEPKQIPDGSGGLKDNPQSGAFVKGTKVQDSYTSEEWAPPRGCTARMYNNQVLTDQQALPAFGTTENRMCVEAPMMGVATGASDSAGGSQTVNGNYGFTTSKVNLYPPTDLVHNPGGLALYAPLPDGQEQDLPARDYIVSVDIPNDPVDGKPMYQVTKEEDVNVFDGDTYLPQENYPPATPAAANDPAGPPNATPVPPTQPPSQQAGIISDCVGPLHKVNVTNAAFNAGGGSPFQGLDRPLCNDKLVGLRANQATAPNFNLFTDVPIPTHFWGLTLNDLGLTLDKRSVNYGEAQGLPFVPVGLYDWAGRLVDTLHTDFNGIYEGLEPSTGTYNCPVPAGPCPNMYRFVGNDPGQPGALNPDYNSRFRTIATNFQAWPGLYTVTDEAPTQVAATVLAPDTTTVNPTMCDLGANAPQLLAVSRPYIRRGDPNRSITVSGLGFGAPGAPDQVTLNGTGVTITSWSNKSITFTVPALFPLGSATLAITGHNGQKSVNGITLQVLDSAGASVPGTGANNPLIAEVGPGKPFSKVQAALEAAKPTMAVRNSAGVVTTPAKPFWLVVVWPNTPSSTNPRGDYNENLIVHHQVKIQGVGPGGFDADKNWVPGSILDGAGFNLDNPNGAAWISLLSGLNYSGNPAVPDSAVVTVLDDPALANLTPATWPVTLDGFSITGGAQADIPGNVNVVTGAIKTPYGATGSLITQGGGVYAHANVRGLRVTDNLINGNGGSYGGAVRIGTPYVGDNHNYNAVISRNQIRDNGGTNLAGGIGLFTGSDGYNIEANAICGNFSAEYGGAITAYGYMANGGAPAGGKITNNRIWFNASYDEGGGIMVAGELPATPTELSPGTGPVTINRNIVQANLANDDGGGIRLLMTSGSHISRANPQPIDITNNTIADNVSAHEGGGVAMDDAVFVNIVNNTVTKNLTTATAVTSNGDPAPAGLSTAANSDPLQARLRNTALFPGSPTLGSTLFSKPTLLNDVFWDNRAGSFSGGYVYGIGGKLPDGTANFVNTWDMGAADVPGALLTPTHSVLQDETGSASDSSNSLADPGFVSPYDVTVNVLAVRSYPAFRQAVIVAQLLPPSLMGDFHLKTGSPASSARGLGAASTTVRWGTTSTSWSYPVNAPTPDIDGQPRPTVTGILFPTRRYDAGSDQMTP
ncbi:MAG: large repetitive protein [Kribbellaceae bacterium]|nr:large repetitive protein [Kribbellaceae bacterium]